MKTEEIQRKTPDEEVAWFKETFDLSRPLILEGIIIALTQRVRVKKDPAEKQYWQEVIDKLKII